MAGRPAIVAAAKVTTAAAAAPVATVPAAKIVATAEIFTIAIAVPATVPAASAEAARTRDSWRSERAGAGTRHCARWRAR